MKYLHLVWAGLKRRKLRTLFTLLSTFFAFVLFGLLAATKTAFQGGIDVANAERLFVMSKVSIINPLPASYRQRLETIEEIEAISPSAWFGGYYQEEKNFFAQFSADDSYLDMYSDQLILSQEERDAWNRDRTGALLGEALANRFGWKVGDRIPIITPLYQQADGSNTWEFTISGIMRGSSEKVDTTYMLFHNEYLEEGRAFGKGTTGWYTIKVADVSQSESVAARVDEMFMNSSFETKTMPEDAWVKSFISQVGNIGKIFASIVTVVLFTLFLVTANTMAQGVRERTSELAVMNVLGFSRQKLAALMMTESIVLILIGGSLAVLVAVFLSKGMAAQLQGFLPGFYFGPDAIALAFGLMLLLGVLSGLVPAFRALTMRNIEGLARAG